MHLKLVLCFGIAIGLLLSASECRDSVKIDSNKRTSLTGQDDPELKTGVQPRPSEPLAWYSRIKIPKITSACKSHGRLSLAKHCAKYLSCKTKNLGVEKTCKRGYLFDAVTKACIPEKFVNCYVY